MAWFLNCYRCYRCQREWTDEWSCACDDECPYCGARHVSPRSSDDLTYVIIEDDGAFIVLRSPESADDIPDYEEVTRFLSARLAAEYVETAGN